MASNRIDINVNGKDNTAAAFNSASKNITNLTTVSQKSGNTIGSAISNGVNRAAASLNSLKNVATSVGSTIGSAISSGAARAAGSIRALGASASSTFSMIKAGASAAAASVGDMGSAVSGLMGGFTAASAASMAWTGASQRQFNEMYLGTKMSTAAANEYLGSIQKIVAAVPGDDTWMNALLTGAVAKQTNLSIDMLTRLGSAASKYVTAAQQTGASILPVNAERELTSYIKSGNTGLMVRDGLLKMHIKDLEAAKTPEERILALEKAMTEEGYLQLDTAALVSSKWETIKGTIAMAATNVGMKLLPFVERVLNFIMDLDAKTKGWSTTIGFVGAAIAGLALAIAPVVGATLSGYYAMKQYRIEAEKAAIANAMNKGPGGATVNPGGMTPINLGNVGLGALTTYAGWQAIASGATLTAGALAAVGTAGTGALMVIDRLSQGLSHMLQKMVVPQAAKDVIDFFVTLPAKLTFGKETVSKGLGAIFDVGPIGTFVYLTQSLGNALGSVSKALEVIKFLLSGGTFNTTQVDGVTKSVTATAGAVNGLTGAWINFVTWFNSGAASITASFNSMSAYIRGAWNNTVAFVMGKWNELKSVVSRGVSTTVNIFWGPIQTAINKFWELYNTVRNNPIVQTIVTIASSGASAVSNVVNAGKSAWSWLTGARGPGDVHYQDYAGYTGKNAWQADGSLAGNCVDMSMGLVSRYGGSLVNGTWNGGLHTWWKAPDGQEYDPSRKALNNTWAPPASRGPGNSSGQTIVIQGDIYGFNDFQKKVQQANNRIVSGVH